MLNQRELEMLWCATEEQFFLFSIDGERSDPRYKEEDWRRLLFRLQENLELLGAGIPKPLVRK